MNGKARAINSICSSADCAAVAARLRVAADDALCLTPSAAVAAEIRQQLKQPADGSVDGGGGAGGCRRVPLLLPLPQLLAAAATLPIDAALPRRAAVLAAAGGGAALVWQLYERLRPHCGERHAIAARLQLAQKLAALFAEVDAGMPLADGQNPFAALAQAEGLSHEAGVAQAMWALLSEEGTDIGSQPLLRRLAGALPPLLAVCDEDTPPAVREFYRRCDAEVMEVGAADEERQWREAFTLDGELPAECRHEAMQGVGETLSAAAAAAASALGAWLARLPDESRIGVVVHDRLLARRLRAVAESAGVAIADSSGWRADSLSFGAALSVHANALLAPFDIDAIGALLQPPFYANEKTLPAAARRWHEWLADALFLPEDIDGVERLLAAMRRPPPPALSAVISDLCAARRRLAEARTPGAWLDALQESAGGALAAWRDDAVAQKVWRKLRARGAGMAALTSEEMLLWLGDALASENISDGDISSRVEFVGPDTRRTFDALLLLGYAGKAAGDMPGWLGERERERLGLPLRVDRFDAQRRQFCRLLATHARIAAVWCAQDEAGKPVEANPFWQLFAAHCAGGGRLQSVACPVDTRIAEGVAAPAPAAAVAPGLPPALSPSVADSLMRCPYAFYSGALLGLADCEKADSSALPPRLAGTVMHRALSAFADASAALEGHDALMACWRQTLADCGRGNRPALPLQLSYWRANSEWFIEWECERRAAGWRTYATEETFSAMLPLPDGAAVELRGRIDRLDETADDVVAVIDYKSGMLPSRKELAAGEKPQLPLYAFLARAVWGRAVDESLLCRPLHKSAAVVDGDGDERRVAARLRRVLREMAAGAPLPANGSAAACAGCDHAGVCRREHWRG